jgi:hypothetical protein
LGTSIIKKLGLSLVLLAIPALSACTPEEFQVFKQVTASDLNSSDEANVVCDWIFGVGSGEPGGDCHDAAVKAVANAQTAAMYAEFEVQQFGDCHSAVDYFFAGRWDLARAHRIVQRESGNFPGAVSRAGARGCAQLMPAMRNAFLEGPWDDPYWNVKAMFMAVNDPNWGWCHWDIVNFCKRGGEF